MPSPTIEDLAALAPLAARVCPWAADGIAGSPESGDGPDDEPVRAMPLVLRIERAEPPGALALLEAAAAASLALCLDDRAAPGGPWHDAVATWAGAGRIRKLARRARTSHWRAVTGIDGVTAGEEPAQVRALVPGPVDEVAHEVRRLQIGGTDLPPAPDPGPPPDDRPVIWLNPTVEQSTGKAAAQVGHASMILATVLAWTGAEEAEVSGVTSAVVRTASSSDWATWEAALGGLGGGPDDARVAWERHGVAPVRDAGFTEVAPGTMTCLGQRAGVRS